MLLHLGESASVKDILECLGVPMVPSFSIPVCSNNFTWRNMSLLSQSLSGGNGLQDIVVLLKEHGKVTPSSAEDILKYKFWTGLQSEHIRTATCHRCIPRWVISWNLGLCSSCWGGVQGTSSIQQASQILAGNSPGESQSKAGIVATVASAEVKAVKPMLEQMMAALSLQQKTMTQYGFAGQLQSFGANRLLTMKPPVRCCQVWTTGSHQAQLQSSAATKQAESYTGKRVTGLSSSSSHAGRDGLLGRMVGPQTESWLQVEDVRCQGLIDTGLVVTTIAESFWRQRLTGTPLWPLNYILRVEGASEQVVQYLGYVEVCIHFGEGCGWW